MKADTIYFKLRSYDRVPAFREHVRASKIIKGDEWFLDFRENIRNSLVATLPALENELPEKLYRGTCAHLLELVQV